MCGIAGIFNYKSDVIPVDKTELLRMRERMINRGPDGAGLWIAEDQLVGLAHRRLAIIDLSEAAAQPMVDAETGNRIVFNGEIYNFRALRSELKVAGYRFHSHSDTEVLLKLYAAHGQEMLHKLRGMYAFGIWEPEPVASSSPVIPSASSRFTMQTMAILSGSPPRSRHYLREGLLTHLPNRLGTWASLSGARYLNPIPSTKGFMRCQRGQVCRLIVPAKGESTRMSFFWTLRSELHEFESKFERTKENAHPGSSQHPA